MACIIQEGTHYLNSLIVFVSVLDLDLVLWRSDEEYDTERNSRLTLLSSCELFESLLPSMSLDGGCPTTTGGPRCCGLVPSPIVIISN